MTPESKRRLTVVALIAVIAGSCAWIYFVQLSAPKFNVGLQRRIGEVLAEQTASVVGKKGKVVTMAIDTKEWPELKTQLQAFKATLKKLGDYELREYEMDTKDQPKYGVGSGLSGRRYVRTVNKNTNASVFVSFIGAPKLSKEEMAELAIKPRFIAESRSVDNLPKLFEHQLIDVAVVSRFQYPAPPPEKPGTAQEWFTKRFQVVTPQSVANVPKAETE